MLKIKESTVEKVPLTLLLQADPSPEKIQSYLPKAEIITAENEMGETIGVCVFVLEKASAEIKNISVKKANQGTGIGKKMLMAALNICRKAGVKSISVGTGNSSIGQLAFYQKCGFEIVGIKPDYFLENYPEPIFENGIQCKHQIILRHDFSNF